MEADGYFSGISVALSSNGQQLGTGVSSNDCNGYDSDHVRVFEYEGGTWNQLGDDIDWEAAEDLSGQSVSLSCDGQQIAIGAYCNITIYWNSQLCRYMIYGITFRNYVRSFYSFRNVALDSPLVTSSLFSVREKHFVSRDFASKSQFSSHSCMID